MGSFRLRPASHCHRYRQRPRQEAWHVHGVPNLELRDPPASQEGKPHTHRAPHPRDPGPPSLALLELCTPRPALARWVQAASSGPDGGQGCLRLLVIQLNTQRAVFRESGSCPTSSPGDLGVFPAPHPEPGNAKLGVQADMPLGSWTVRILPISTHPRDMGHRLALHTPGLCGAWLPTRSPPTPLTPILGRAMWPLRLHVCAHNTNA